MLLAFPVLVPLDTPEDYERLGEHLHAIDRPLTDFAAAHGYIVRSLLSGGRYPHRRIAQDGVISRSILIAMADQPDGQRFDRFFPEIPYTIFGGAVIDDHAQHLRWHSPFLHTREIPFSSLLSVLPVYLAQFHDYLSRLTAEHIYACAYTSPLSPLPPPTRST